MFAEDSRAEAVEVIGDLHVEPAQPVDAPPAPDVDAVRHGEAERAPRRKDGKPKNVCGAPKADGSGPCPAIVAPGRRCPMHDDSPEGRERMALARRHGGMAARVKLGLDSSTVEAISLVDGEGQLAVLTATTKALAQGRITSAAATAIGQLVRTAATIVQADQAAAIAELERRVLELVEARTVRR